MLIETRGGISKPQHQSFLTRSRLIFITLFLSWVMIQDVDLPFPKEKALMIFYPLIEETRILFLTVYLATQCLLFRRNFYEYSLIQRNTSLFGGSGSRKMEKYVRIDFGQYLIAYKVKHCQRHNGPEGWVHLAKVTSWGHIRSSNISLDHISSSESGLSIS